VSNVVTNLLPRNPYHYKFHKIGDHVDSLLVASLEIEKPTQANVDTTGMLPGW